MIISVWITLESAGDVYVFATTFRNARSVRFRKKSMFTHMDVTLVYGAKHMGTHMTCCQYTHVNGATFCSMFTQ